jgi:hypothetical protein
MEILIKILWWIIGIVITVAAWSVIFAIAELKVLIFDKTLTLEEKKEIRKELRLFFIVPVIFSILYIFHFTGSL